MNIIDLAQKYNKLIRETDNLRQKKIHSTSGALSGAQLHFFPQLNRLSIDEAVEGVSSLNLNSSLETTTVESEIVLYKEERYQEQLKKLLKTYQLTLDKTGTLEFKEIAELAKNIVNAQKFCDGNHRTALFLCYHLALFTQHKLLRIKPYLLYAAIDFEYLKSIHDLSTVQGEIFRGNAIEMAIDSRATGVVNSMEIKQFHLEKIRTEIMNMPVFLDSLSKQKLSGTKESITVREKLFCQFLGFRPDMSHSTTVMPLFYLSWLEQEKKRTKPFNRSLNESCSRLNLFAHRQPCTSSNEDSHSIIENIELPHAAAAEGGSSRVRKAT